MNFGDSYALSVDHRVSNLIAISSRSYFRSRLFNFGSTKSPILYNRRMLFNRIGKSCTVAFL